MSDSEKPKPRQYRQGDILLVETDEELPEGKVVEDGLVARGEMTGHAHRIVNGIVLMHVLGLFVKARDGTRLVHEEHAEIALPAGRYKVIRQREATDNDEPRTVSD